MAIPRPQTALQGIPVSPGIVIGKVFVLRDPKHMIEPRDIDPGSVDAEIERFTNAVDTAKKMIREFRHKVMREVGEAEARIFDSHLHILADNELIGKTIARIKKEHKNAEYIFNQAVERITAKLRSIENPYIAERTNDVEDVGRRVMNNLLDIEQDPLARLKEPVIVIAHDIAPSDTAHMSRQKIIGFATDKGGRTSHTAIMANAIEIPAVVGADGLTKCTRTGDTVIVDGIKGRVIVRPEQKTLQKYQEAIFEHQAFINSLSTDGALPADTLDGYTIELGANIELPEEIPHIFNHGCDRIGLFRTEFLYMDNPSAMPTEDEQYEVFRSVAAELQPNPVIIRTLDLGGDKFVSTVPMAQEINPYLGLRAIRLCLQFPEILKSQLKAMLRASVYGNIRIMIPMISNLAEVIQVKKIYKECRDELRAQKIAFKRRIEFGIMIETPAAAIAADHLVDEVDFFSIGTNDLIQYTLAVDRGNEQVAHLYEPFNPAVLRLIDHVINVAQTRGIWVGVCGEVAGDPLMAALLTGMGVDELSMSPVRVPLIKEVIRHVYLSDIKELAQEAMLLKSHKEIKKLVYKRLKGLIPNSEWVLTMTEAELKEIL